MFRMSKMEINMKNGSMGSESRQCEVGLKREWNGAGRGSARMAGAKSTAELGIKWLP